MRGVRARYGFHTNADTLRGFCEDQFDGPFSYRKY
jgi:hypothetical protein